MAINLKGRRQYLVVISSIIHLTMPVFADANAQPQNAATLYQPLVAKFENNPNYSSKSTVMDALQKYVHGKGPLNDEIRRCVANNRDAIETVQKAADIPECDWGLNYSKGLEMTIPHLSTCRTLAYIILADARICADTGKYKEALQKCLCAYKFGKQVAAPKCLICYLVDAAIVGMSLQNIQHILNSMPMDEDTLRWLKQQMVEIDERPEPAITGLLAADLEVVGGSISPKNIHLFGFDQEMQKQLRNADDQFWVKNKAYWQKSLRDTTKALQKPYPQAVAALNKIRDAATQDTAPDATLTKVLYPAYDKVLSISKRRETDINATKTAVDIYIIERQTGKLPDKLPPNEPHDAFSGKPFVYKKTSDGFTLTCQGRDLSKPEESPKEFRFKCNK